MTTNAESTLAETADENLEARAKLSGELIYLEHEHLATAASLLFQAYQDDPLFLSIFQAHKEGYEQRLRAAIREELAVFYQHEQPIFGLFEGDTLEGVVCMTRPGAAFGPERFWHWRLRMLLTAGYVSTKQMLEKERIIAEAMPVNHYHMLTFIAVHPNYQQHGLGDLLVHAARAELVEAPESAGIGLLATRPNYAKFFAQRGFHHLRDIQVGEITGQLMFFAREDEELD
ncbi:GNAT family N-acetyltransferase [Aliidiomarina iranensis]|uniref:GNAT family N-acetyltransferase n=1 Tax=Aliidiomarina iranensis TaxID=1434071 RepID=A0A432W0Y2_9GAMM|nr:GNAT family N-acetyltransferase [Aliidiomarina iranensis]RUO22551.1 GNAT family N-acetyltransferase [Aliidiomarina iranensis]